MELGKRGDGKGMGWGGPYVGEQGKEKGVWLGAGQEQNLGHARDL